MKYMSRVSDRNAMPHVRGRKKEREDSDVAINVNYGVALFSSCIKSISNPKTEVHELEDLPLPKNYFPKRFLQCEHEPW